MSKTFHSPQAVVGASLVLRPGAAGFVPEGPPTKPPSRSRAMM